MYRMALFDNVNVDIGAEAGNTKIKSDDQPDESPEGEVARVRAKRLLRTDKPNYFDNEDFEEEVLLQ